MINNNLFRWGTTHPSGMKMCFSFRLFIRYLYTCWYFVFSLERPRRFLSPFGRAFGVPANLQFVGRAEALSASNSPSDFCAHQLPTAKVVVNHIPHFRVNPCSSVVRRVLLAFTLYTLHQKNREKNAIPLHTSKKSCNFVAESPAPGLEGGKCPLSESQLIWPNTPIVAFKTY